MCNKNKQKYVKDSIVYMAKIIKNDFDKKGHTSFRFNLDGEVAYLLYDKAICKRLEKYLRDNYNMLSDIWIDGFEILTYSYDLNIKVWKFLID